jgi:MFS family permease
MAFFKKGEFNLLWPFYLETFISKLFWIFPAFWIIQLQNYLSLTQIGLLFSVLAIASFLFEIPTGAIADIYSRKFSVVLGYILSGLTLLSLLFFKEFYTLLIIFSLYGIFQTFISGAKEAWVADNLKFNKKSKLIQDYFIKNGSFVMFSLFFSGFIGAFFVKFFGIDIIWPVTGFSLLISGLLLLFIKEEKVTTQEKKYLKEIYTQSKSSIKYSLKHKIIFTLIISLFFFSFWGIFGGDLVWQPFLKDLGFPVYAFGFLFSGLTLAGVFTPFLAQPILKILKKENRFLALSMFSIIIVLTLVLFVNHWVLGVVLYFILFLLMTIHHPIRQAYFQKFIPSNMRATITSFEGMVIALAIAISAPLAGFMADVFGPRVSIFVSSIVLIPAIFLYLKIKEKPNHLSSL